MIVSLRMARRVDTTYESIGLAKIRTSTQSLDRAVDVLRVIQEHLRRLEVLAAGGEMV